MNIEQIEDSEIKDLWAESDFPYGGPVYGEEEISKMIDALKTGRFWAGKYTRQFEKDVEEYLKVKHAIFCNSGSSALLMTISSLKLPKGSKVVTQALAFPTSINSIIQNGLIPTFIDVDIESLNVDPEMVKDAVESTDAKAYLHTHTIGNCPDMDKLSKYIEALDIYMIEDTCDSMGSKFGDKYLGTFGDVGCTSFHPAHQMTCGLGGMLFTDNDDLAKKAYKIRDWGRTSQEKLVDRFVGGYDMRYHYQEMGYNLQAPEVCAAMGLVQLRRLDEFNRIRMRNFEMLKIFFSKYQDMFILPKAHSKGNISWFGYPVIMNSSTFAKYGIEHRFELMQKFEDVGIQTRSIYGGTIVRQPYFKGIDYYSVHPKINNDDYLDPKYWAKNSEYISDYTFWISCWHGLSEEKNNIMIERIKGIINDIKENRTR